VIAVAQAFRPAGAVAIRIILVRHGKPDGMSAKGISGRGIGEWVRGYDSVGISRTLEPPAGVRALAMQATCFVASDLPRARQSAAWLAGTRRVIHDRDLREAVLPESLGISLTLPPGVWVVVARLAWFLNWGNANETVAATHARAARIANGLAVLAAEHGCVMAVGHGMFNRFLAGELRRRGWRGPKVLPGGYWGAAAFECETMKTAAPRQG